MPDSDDSDVLDNSDDLDVLDVLDDLELTEVFDARRDLTEMLSMFVGVPTKSERFRELADRFIRARKGPIHAATISLLRRYNFDQEWYDRGEQVVMVGLVRLLREVATGKLPATAEGWHRRAVVRGVRIGREIIDQNRSLAVASGMTGYARRRRVIEQVRSDLRQRLGREPDDEEIVAEANDRQTHLKDASKASMHITLADLVVDNAAVNIDAIPELFDDPDPTSARVLADRQAVATANAIIRGIHEQRPHPTREGLPSLSEVATFWLRQVCLDQDDSSSAVAEEFGIGERTARRYLAEIRTLAAELLADAGR